MSSSPEAPGGQTFYDEIGGYPTIAKIVDRFYEGVATDEVLRPLYPEEDLGPAAERFTLFLVQYWGGPTTYSDTRGHPRLRMRHFPYSVGPLERDRWLAHMSTAIDEVCDALAGRWRDEPREQFVTGYRTPPALPIVNTPSSSESRLKSMVPRNTPGFRAFAPV